MFLPSKRGIKEINISFISTCTTRYFQILGRSPCHIGTQRLFVNIVSFLPPAQIIQTETFAHQFNSSLSTHFPQKSRNGRITLRIKSIINIIHHHFRHISSCPKFVNRLIRSSLVEFVQFAHRFGIVYHHLTYTEQRGICCIHPIRVGSYSMCIIIFPYPEAHLGSVPALSPVHILKVRLSLHGESFKVGRRQTMISFTGNRSH